MTKADQKILFTALAFVAVVMKGHDAGSHDAAARIRQFTGLIEAFCAETLPGALSVVDEHGEEATDRIIERHVRELRENEQTRLPDDKETLLQLFDRLQQRKSRRMQREFYASVSEAKLADLVLRYLDEEIENSDSEALI